MLFIHFFFACVYLLFTFLFLEQIVVGFWMHIAISTAAFMAGITALVLAYQSLQRRS